ncbi:unnamed protein product [Caenorhabditis angaria]|uniref:Uncharacterized protein n=1 Tax=Caenorhabditis angaria TaxID=860376 RepID=A0A9P1N4L1_9PELO|nr:unnamed protein product [Caenorhabditis angaria]
MMPVASSLRSFNRNPIIMPNSFLSCQDLYSRHDKFLDRLRTIKDYLVDQITSGVIASRINEKTGKFFDLRNSSKSELFQKSLITLIDLPDQFSVTSPKGHDIFSIGTHCPSSKLSKLPQEFLDFIEDPKSRGTIYVAFGSYVNLDSGPPGVVEKFKDALNQFQRLSSDLEL